MKFKIDTREKFTVITPDVENLYANITEELKYTSLKCLESDIKNIILNLKNITDLDLSGGEALASLQNEFYEKNSSFVICGMKEAIEKKLDEMQLLDMMNITPTESEAWDIVQMEEIERELLDSDDVEFENNN